MTEPVPPVRGPEPWVDPWDDLETWQQAAVDGQVTVLRNGQVILLHTSPLTEMYVDEIFAKKVPGQPVELRPAGAQTTAMNLLRAAGYPDYVLRGVGSLLAQHEAYRDAVDEQRAQIAIRRLQG